MHCIPYSLDLTDMPVYFSNPLWGARVLESARVFESARLIFKNLSGRTLPTDSSLRRVPVKSRVPVYSRVHVYFSILVRDARVIESGLQIESARQIERIRYLRSLELTRSTNVLVDAEVDIGRDDGSSNVNVAELAGKQLNGSRRRSQSRNHATM